MKSHIAQECYKEHDAKDVEGCVCAGTNASELVVIECAWIDVVDIVHKSNY